MLLELLKALEDTVFGLPKPLPSGQVNTISAHLT